MSASLEPARNTPAQSGERQSGERARAQGKEHPDHRAGTYSRVLGLEELSTPEPRGEHRELLPWDRSASHGVGAREEDVGAARGDEGGCPRDGEPAGEGRDGRLARGRLARGRLARGCVFADRTHELREDERDGDERAGQEPKWMGEHGASEGERGRADPAS